MPFTFSHPAVVLPFNYLSRKWLSLTGLVIGSMTPDFEYFLRMKVLSKYSHTCMGLFWYDLPLGCMLTLIYSNLIKDNLIDHLPAFFNKRLSTYKNSDVIKPWYYLLVVASSVLIGALTHILWDSFTHPMGYFVLRLHELKHQVSIANHHFRTYNILQQLSSLAGAIFIIVAIVSLPVHHLTKIKSIVHYWLILIIVAILIVILRLITGLNWQQYGDVIVTAIAAMFIGLIATSVLSPLIKV